ncbi:MAG: general secretion pathway protein G [Lentimonas sp.]|jgi:general secretion pathway protein G
MHRLFLNTPAEDNPQADPRPKAEQANGGFTLIEMLIVIGLIAAIMSIVVVNFGGTSEQAKFQLVDTFVNGAIAVPLESYKSVNGRYPTTEQGLKALLQPLPRTKQAPLKKLSNDPWGQAYQYRFPSQKNPGSYDIWSIGPDGKLGTEDDVGNWD